jgi:hypothetical protein
MSGAPASGVPASGPFAAAPPVRAPRQDRSAFVAPGFDAVGPLLAATIANAAFERCRLLDRPLARLRGEARQELVQTALRYTRGYRDVAIAQDLIASSVPPVLMAGHQPELFHPGVWFKNLALARLGERHRAVPINLVIDNDACKGESIRVPGGAVDAPRVASIPFDRPDAARRDVPWEDRRIEDEDVLAEFSGRVVAQLRTLVPEPMVREFWPMVLRRAQETRRLGQCLAQARHQWEERWGFSTLEAPYSQVCDLRAYGWYVGHLLAHLPDLWAIHNQSLAEYRRAHGLRSATHPVPDLSQEGEWLEAPLWVWTSDDPRRRRAFARRTGGELILTDRRQFTARLPLSADGDGRRAVEALGDIARSGVRIRTRALFTTLFARLVLSDLFLHGIGGATYDRLTDAIACRLLGIHPPPFLTLTATLHLPIARKEKEPIPSVREIDAELRRLTWQPERFLGEVADSAPAGEAQTLAAEKRRWIATVPTPDNYRQRFLAIRNLNEQLQSRLADQRAELQRLREAAVRQQGTEKVLSSREYSFCLFPENILRDFLLEKLPPNV